MQRNRRRGNTLLEFTLVGIPLIFVLISIFEIARGMWAYDTLAHAVREGTRFAIVHGANCWPNAADPTSNSCQVTVGDIARRIRLGAVGLPDDELRLTFTAQYQSLPPCLMRDCLNNTTVWPPAGANYPGATLQISALYPFHSAISMFWPGTSSAVIFPAYNLPAVSSDAVVF